MPKNDSLKTRLSGFITRMLGWFTSRQAIWQSSSSTNRIRFLGLDGKETIISGSTAATTYVDCLNAAKLIVSTYRAQAPLNFDPQAKGGGTPKPPDPPKPPAPSTAAENLAKRMHTERRMKARGYASTVLTGGLGGGNEASANGGGTRYKTLLGQ
jgi:hypothetical protein